MTTTTRTEYQCKQCDRIVIDWRRTSHWQAHNPNHPHANCCGTPRDEVKAAFIEVTR